MAKGRCKRCGQTEESPGARICACCHAWLRYEKQEARKRAKKRRARLRRNHRIVVTCDLAQAGSTDQTVFTAVEMSPDGSLRVFNHEEVMSSGELSQLRNSAERLEGTAVMPRAAKEKADG